MKKTFLLKFASALLVLLAASFFIYWKWFSEESPKSSKDLSFPVERGNLFLTIEATGTVQPEKRLEVKPPINGRIESLMTDVGHKVISGQILAYMSSTDRAALMDLAKTKGGDESNLVDEIFRPAPIVAPIGGVIIVKNIESGQVVSTQDTVFVLSDRPIVMAQVDETDLAQVKIGQQVEIKLDAYPKDAFYGRVDQIAFESRVVSNVTMYDVKIIPEDAPDFMRAGMSASVVFNVASREGVILIPLTAIDRDNTGNFVNIAKSIGSDKPSTSSFERRQIELGLNDGMRTEVLSGLSEGDMIVDVKNSNNPQKPSEQGQPKVKEDNNSNPLVPTRRGRGSRSKGK